jgi:hypothetical protein
MRDVPQEGRAWGDEELGLPWFPFAIPVPPSDYEGGIRGVRWPGSMARASQPQVAAMGQSDPLPRTPLGQWSALFALIRNGLAMGQHYHRTRRENRKPAGPRDAAKNQEPSLTPPSRTQKSRAGSPLVGVWERQPLTASPHIMILITDIPNIARSVVLQTSRLARAISRAAGRRSPGPSR